VKNFLLKKSSLILIVVFLTGILVKFYLDYQKSSKDIDDLALMQSRLLKDFFLVNRHYYQNLYAKNIILLNEKTVQGLPAYASYTISKLFSKKNSEDITIKTVSDIPRNPLNRADIYEMNAIEYFKKYKNKNEYFRKLENFYQYAYVLKITEKCLLCHGKKENAPLFIQKHYFNAYNYKIGDVRGVLSIKIPRKSIKKYMWFSLASNIVLDLLIIFTIFAFVYLIYRFLNREIDRRTQQIKYMYEHDMLTDLPNKNILKKHLKEETDKLAIFNIENFKHINEFFGIDQGDKILKTIAEILKTKADKFSLKVYRLDSDEFAIIPLKKLSKRKFVNNIKNLIKVLNDVKYKINKSDIYISVRAGLSFDKSNLLKTADIAIKLAKSKNKDLIVYSKKDNVEKKIENNIKMINNIKYAIENKTVFFEYQPIYDIKIKKAVKFEILMRLKDDNGKIYYPNQFIEVAKQARLYIRLSEILIEHLIELYKKYPDYIFSINLSKEDMENNIFTNKLNSFIKNVKQEKILEILESENIENYNEMKKFIKKYKKRGIKFAVDDFGTGYSNFYHIIELDFDYLKIDGSIVRNILKSTTSQEVVKAIVAFANTMNMDVVAEFVENREIASKLKEIGIRYYQGYYIGKPKEELQVIENLDF